MTAKGNLMWALENIGRDEEALQGRLEMAKTMEQHLASTRPELAASNYTSIGVESARLGRLADAETALRQALAVWAKLQGSNDEWDSADPMRQLADVLRWRGHYAEAEAEMRHAVAIEAKHEPPSSGWLNRDRAALGDILRVQHHYDEALREISAAVAARGDVKADPIQVTLLMRLSFAQLDAGNAMIARQTAENSVAMAQAIFPAKHFNRATPTYALARADLALGRAAEAEPLLRETLALRSPPYPPSDLRVVEVKVSLVDALTALNRAAEARGFREEVEPVLKASDSPYAAELLARLGGPLPSRPAH
jgi:serine/threonine-protein kinase